MYKRYILPFVLFTFMMVAAIVFGISLALFLLRSRDGFTLNIPLAEDGVTYEDLDFSANGMKPGDSHEYTINLKSKLAATYSVSIAFTEIEDGGLRDYINVTVSYNEECATFSLAELFEGETFAFTCDVARASPAEIRIVFSMPEWVGNEAQGTTTDFNTTLTAERK